MSTATTDRGRSLARGPALILGSILLAFGLIAMIKHSAFPAFGEGFPDGTATGSKFLGFEVNGWTNWLVCVAGGALLFGAAQHLLAKMMSLIVGGVLGAAAVIALIDGDILGLGAANSVTVIGLAIAAVVLLVNTLMPRLGKDRGKDADVDRDHDNRLDDDERTRDRATTGRFAHRGDAANGSESRTGSVSADH